MTTSPDTAGKLQSGTKVGVAFPPGGDAHVGTIMWENPERANRRHGHKHDYRGAGLNQPLPAIDPSCARGSESPKCRVLRVPMCTQDAKVLLRLEVHISAFLHDRREVRNVIKYGKKRKKTLFSSASVRMTR